MPDIDFGPAIRALFIVGILCGLVGGGLLLVLLRAIGL